MGKEDAITIDFMRKEDMDQVLAIEQESFSKPWSKNLFLSEFRSPAVSTLLVARAEWPERAVAGYIVFWVVAGEAHLLNLAVAPRFRMKGIGRQLTLAALKRAYERGARRVFLEVRMSNAAAQKLYSSIGFAGTSVRRDYYDSPVEDALVMTLEQGPFQSVINHLNRE